MNPSSVQQTGIVTPWRGDFWCLYGVALYHTWRYLALFSVRYCLNYNFLLLLSYRYFFTLQTKDFCTVDNYTTLMMLAKNHVSAFVGSECVLWSDLFKTLRRDNSHDKIYAFPIEGFDTKLKISLVYNKWSVLPIYTRELIKIARDMYQHDAYFNYLKKT